MQVEKNQHSIAQAAMKRVQGMPTKLATVLIVKDIKVY